MDTQNNLQNVDKIDVVTNVIKTYVVTDVDKIDNTSNILLNNLDELYKYIKSIHENKITTLNIILITSELIQIVEKYKNLTGGQKKMLVINVIKKIINEQVSSEEEKIALNLIINNVVPQAIDGFVDAINGVVKFTKNIKPNFFKKLFCCC